MTGIANIFTNALGDNIGRLEEQPLALSGACRRPGRECGMRGGNRSCGLGAPARCHFGDKLAIERIGDGETGAARLRPFAIDEMGGPPNPGLHLAGFVHRHNSFDGPRLSAGLVLAVIAPLSGAKRARASRDWSRRRAACRRE